MNIITCYFKINRTEINYIKNINCMNVNEYQMFSSQ